MEYKTIETDGDYDLPDGLWTVRRSDSTIVHIIDNQDDAVITFGFADSDDNFVAWPNGQVSTGKKINHGFKCKLMVRISGITANGVVIGLSESKN